MKEDIAQKRFVVEEVETVTLPYNDALIEIENSLAGTEKELTDVVLPHLLPELVALHGLDNPSRHERDLDKIVDQYRQSLDFLRGATEEEAEIAIGNHTMGLFVMTGGDYEPNAQELFDELFAKQKADFAEMLTMTDEQLRDRLALTEEQHGEINAMVLRPEVQGTIREMLLILTRHHRGTAVTTEVLGRKMVDAMHVGMPTWGEEEQPLRPDDRNIHGLTLPQIEQLVDVVLEGILGHDVLSQGSELYWRDTSPAEQGRIVVDPRTEPEVKLARFILKTEV